MNILLLGAGAVGEAYGVLARHADPHYEWLDKLVIADFSLDRARSVADRFGGGERFPAIEIDAIRLSTEANLFKVTDTNNPFCPFFGISQSRKQ